MVKNMTFKDKIIIGVYLIAWVVLSVGTFPRLDSTVNHIAIVFPLSVVIMLHFFDMAYCLYTQDLNKERLIKIGIINNLFGAFIVFFLIKTITVEVLKIKIVYFILFWICMFLIKYANITLTWRGIQLKITD